MTKQEKAILKRFRKAGLKAASNYARWNATPEAERDRNRRWR